MKPFDGLKWLGFLMMVLISASRSEGQTTGLFFTWEPFQTKVGLTEKLAPNLSVRALVLPDDAVPSKINLLKLEADAAQVREGGDLNLYQYQRFRLSLSSMANHDAVGRKIQGPSNEESKKLKEIKALPSLLQDSMYRETFESVGRIFEPQLNLSIEF